MTEYNFPNQYSTALQLLVDGTLCVCVLCSVCVCVRMTWYVANVKRTFGGNLSVANCGMVSWRSSLTSVRISEVQMQGSIINTEPQLLFFLCYSFYNNFNSSPSSCPTNAGTDTNQLNPTCWQDLIDIITDSSSSDNCCLGLQQIQDTLTHHYMEKRLFAQECLYDLLSHDYIKLVSCWECSVLH